MADLSPDTVLALTDKASVQPLGDGAVVLLVDSGQLYSCNETTESFLLKIDGKRDFDAIVTLFRDEYEVEEAIARRDLTELARQLAAEGIIEPV